MQVTMLENDKKRVCFNHKTGHHEFGVATNSSTWPTLPDALIVVSQECGQDVGE